MDYSLERNRCLDFLEGREVDPFSYLGMHEVRGRLIVRAFQPNADRVEVCHIRSGEPRAELRRMHPEGLYVGWIDAKRGFPYLLGVTSQGQRRLVQDAYRFSEVLTDGDTQLLLRGQHWSLHRVLGARPLVHEDAQGVAFAIWAPQARRVSVVGDFNSWDGRRHIMRFRHRCGVWEIFIPELEPGAIYQYEIEDQDGVVLPLRTDPLAGDIEARSREAGIVTVYDRPWGDNAWCERRSRGELGVQQAMSLYDLDLTRWNMGQERQWHFAEVADHLAEHVGELGFTHVRLKLTPTGADVPSANRHFFSTDPGLGTLSQFQSLVDRLHRQGIGVILSWSAGFFDQHDAGLSLLDGSHLYSHENPDQGQHPARPGQGYFNFGRNEVGNFLVSSGLYWLECAHVDGVFLDDFAWIMYLDHRRDDQAWVPNYLGGNINLAGLDVLRRFNEVVSMNHPGTVTIAGPCSGWPGVTRPTYKGGLGFSLQENHAWANDTLSYFRRDPVHRCYHHHEISISQIHAHNERFVLPVGVGLKGGLLAQMPGDKWQQLANVRAYLGFAWGFPGKKIMAMGDEFAAEELDWNQLTADDHRGVHRLVCQRNRLYRQHPALHQMEAEPAGFRWIQAHEEKLSICCIARLARDQTCLIVACNFTPVPRLDYRLGVVNPGSYREILNSDSEHFGGSGVGDRDIIESEPVACDGFPHSIMIDLPPLGVLYLEQLANP